MNHPTALIPREVHFENVAVSARCPAAILRVDPQTPDSQSPRGRFGPERLTAEGLTLDALRKPLTELRPLKGKGRAPAARPSSYGQRSHLGLVLGLLFLGGCVTVDGIRLFNPDVRYIAFGDSTTAGRSTRDYPDILRSLLGEAPETFANAGLSGETTEEGLQRLESLLAGKIYPDAEVLLYWEGGNDIGEFIKVYDRFLLASPDGADYLLKNELMLRLSQIQVNIEAAIVAARHAGLRVYVSTYFFLWEEVAKCDILPIAVVLPSQANNANVYVAMLNERIRAAAANQDAVLVDVAAIDDVLRQDQANYFDCNHLSEQGNAVVADLFHQAIVGATD